MLLGACALTHLCALPTPFSPTLSTPACPQVRDEIIDNIEATYKETDLFKMLQTGDLANMDRLDASSAARLPSVLRLRDALYAPEFRDFISQVTGGWPGGWVVVMAGCDLVGGCRASRRAGAMRTGW